MGKVTGFLEYNRKNHDKLEVAKRKKNFKEFIIPIKDKELKKQAARCMDCGVPFCQMGCPLGNIIPDFNDYLYKNDTRAAFETLISTNNFPDITGRVCPAPCESACVLGINNDPVTIKDIEHHLGDKGFENNWYTKNKAKKTGKKVAIIGSGPTGLACADQLSSAGHKVVVYEKEDEIGGLLTYGIPNFKLDKKVVSRHVKRMEEKGVQFIKNTQIGKDIPLKKIQKVFNAFVFSIGSTIPKDLKINNRNQEGIYYAMDFLTQSTKLLFKKETTTPLIEVKDKNVLVIGGGDTGSDCIGTSLRRGAKKVTQIEILPKPPKARDASMPWPEYERIYRFSSSQEEGCIRKFSILTTGFIANSKKKLIGIGYNEVLWNREKKMFQKISKEKLLKADIIFLAMGFLHPEPNLLKSLKIKTNSQGNIFTSGNSYKTNVKNIFAAGDARRGQSLVVWAISEGRECALEVDKFLNPNKKSILNSKSSLNH